jgi:hypothetical protein
MTQASVGDVISDWEMIVDTSGAAESPPPM